MWIVISEIGVWWQNLAKKKIGTKKMNQIRKSLTETQRNLKYFEKFRLDWYFSGYFEKVLLILSFVSLIYTIVRIIFQGVW